MFYAVFVDDDDEIVHTTQPRRIWSESITDAFTWIEDYGHLARQFEVLRDTRNGPELAPQRGSIRERSRTRWHIVE